jgi:hypothetical protein
MSRRQAAIDSAGAPPWTRRARRASSSSAWAVDRPVIELCVSVMRPDPLICSLILSRLCYLGRCLRGRGWFMLITPIDWPAFAIYASPPLPPLDAIFPTRFSGRKLDMHGHSLQRSLVLQHLRIRDHKSPASLSKRGTCRMGLSNLSKTWFNGPNLEKFAVVVPPFLTPQTPKLQTSRHLQF